VTWFESMRGRGGNERYGVGQVQINAGHRTVLQPALGILLAAKAFMKERRENRGEETVTYEQSGGRFNLEC